MFIHNLLIININLLMFILGLFMLLQMHYFIFQWLSSIPLYTHNTSLFIHLLIHIKVDYMSQLL